MKAVVLLAMLCWPHDGGETCKRTAIAPFHSLRACGQLAWPAINATLAGLPKRPRVRSYICRYWGDTV
jgi:hypothetical protein